MVPSSLIMDDPVEGPGKKKKPDVLLVHSPVPKGEGYRVVRLREDRVELGQMSDVKEGEPSAARW